MTDAVILVVDDDANTGRYVSRVVSSQGRTVTIAGNGLAARALGGSFDVGVFEIELDGASGIELAEKMLEEGRLGRVVFFSGATWQGLLRRAAALGPIIAKDGGPVALASELCRIVESQPASGFRARALSRVGHGKHPDVDMMRNAGNAEKPRATKHCTVE